MPFEKELEVAKEVAARAAALAIEYQPGIVAEIKSDLSPVTAADRACEHLISTTLAEYFPDDGQIGEEGAGRESRNGRRWIIDPIDGTRDYVRGNPLWANLIALEENGTAVAGVVNLPLLGATYWAARGEGAFRNGERMHVSSKSSISESALCLNGFNFLNGIAFRSRLLDWMDGFWSIRGLGGAADAMLVAGGQAEIWIEPHAALWDLAPLKVIVEEAGGVFLNFDGGKNPGGGNCAICAPGLEAELRKFLGLA